MNLSVVDVCWSFELKSQLVGLLNLNRNIRSLKNNYRVYFGCLVDQVRLCRFFSTCLSLNRNEKMNDEDNTKTSKRKCFPSLICVWYKYSNWSLTVPTESNRKID